MFGAVHCGAGGSEAPAEAGASAEGASGEAEEAGEGAGVSAAGEDAWADGEGDCPGLAVNEPGDPAIARVSARWAAVGSEAAEPSAEGAIPQSASVEVAGTSRLVRAFGFGSELADLPAPATAVIWQSMPIVLWMAWRRFSEWSALPNAPARPEVLKTRVRTWPSNWPTWALGSTSAQVLRLIFASVCRTSGHARRSTSTSPWPPVDDAPAAAWAGEGMAGEDGAGDAAA